MLRLSTKGGFVRRPLVLAAVLGASVAAMGAQVSSGNSISTADNPDVVSSANGSGTQTEPTLNLNLPAVDAQPVTFSSSSSENEIALNAAHFNFADAMQYGGGRRYGKPRYRGGNSNADGSSKWAFLAGVGLAQPVGNTYHYLTPSWGLQLGGGRNFNKNLSLLAQFDYDRFGLNARTLSNQSYIYFGDLNAADNGLDANSHIWSFTIDPTYNIAVSEGLGAYVVVGAGFYHKVANFTLPATGEQCDPYYGCYYYTANQNIDHYSSNAPGFNGGIGFTYKFSRFANERFYGEVRYVVMLNSQRQGCTAANYGTSACSASNNYANYNLYPANSNRTTYLPIKFGIRF
jgi:hypothetical protein